MDELSLRMDVAVSQPQWIFFFDNTRPLKLEAHKRVDRALTREKAFHFGGEQTFRRQFPSG